MTPDVDKAAPEGAGAPGIEMTPAMIDAGQRCLDDLFDATVEVGSDVGLMCIPGGWAEAVYRAMSGAIGRPPEASNSKHPI